MTSYADWVLQPALPDPGIRATRSCLICATQRSGTWLLCGLLDSTEAAGRPHEWFSPGTGEPARERWRVRTDEAYLDAVLRAGTTPNGVFAAKVMWNDVERLEAALRSVPEPRYVWLRRNDVVAQAVSWARAGRTGVYHAWDEAKATREPEFDAAEIEAFVRLIRAQTAGWDAWFRERAIDPLVLRYEDLLASPIAETRRVLELLGVEARRPIGVRTSPPPVGPGDDWTRRYRETARS